MGWLQRIFGQEKPANAQVNPAPTGGDTPAAKVGLNGEFDESGLAKRVALAFDEDAGLADLDRLWVAQLGGTVVLKGEVPSQDLLNKAVMVAKSVSGATDVQTDQVSVG
jgi:osmotically-inducible protein OsmY